MHAYIILASTHPGKAHQADDKRVKDKIVG